MPNLVSLQFEGSLNTRSINDLLRSKDGKTKEIAANDPEIEQARGEYSDEQVKQLALLGQGAYSRVYLVNYNGEKVAAKRTLIPEKNTLETLISCFNEVKCMLLLKGEKNIAQLKKWDIATLEGKNYFFTFMEYGYKGSLFNLIKNKSDFLKSWLNRKNIAFDIVMALSAMHMQGILHKDLKSANVIHDGINAKLIDFGLSNYPDPNPVGKSQGTPLYCAPELTKTINTKKSDIFSLAATMWELVTRSLLDETYPQKNFEQKDLFHFLKTKRLPIPVYDGQLILELIINCCWQNNPDQRLSVQEILLIFKQPAAEFIEKFGHRTPYLLSLVCKHGNLELVKKALLLCPDINEVNYEGHTPLTAACLALPRKTKPEIFDLLLEKGANLSGKSGGVLTALDLALLKNNNIAIHKLLSTIHGKELSLEPVVAQYNIQFLQNWVKKENLASTYDKQFFAKLELARYLDAVAKVLEDCFTYGNVSHGFHTVYNTRSKQHAATYWPRLRDAKDPWTKLTVIEELLSLNQKGMQSDLPVHINKYLRLETPDALPDNLRAYMQDAQSEYKPCISMQNC